MERLVSKRMLLAGVAVALVLVVLAASILFFNNSAQAAGDSPEPEQTETVPVSGEQDEEEESSAIETEDESRDADMQISDIRMRWNGEKWEYSTDKGKTWTDTPPDGVKVGEDGSMNIWQGEGDMEDFDIDAFMQEIDDTIASIESEINEYYGDLMPEGSQGGSFFSNGDTVARQVDGVWEFSTDGGETWTSEAPEGFEIGENGIRYSIGTGEDGLDDFNEEDWFEDWYSGSGSEGNDAGSTIFGPLSTV